MILEDPLELENVNIKNFEKVELISLNKLKYSKNRVRKSINREEIINMAKNLRIFGILQPLEINEKNEVILGARRFEAAKLASFKKVPVIRRKSSEVYEIEKQLVSDLHTKHFSLLERALALQKLLELHNITKYELARYLGLSDNIICRTLSILKASPETFELMKKKKISQRVVATILYRLKDKSKEKYIINKIIKEKLSVAQAENLVAEINDSEILKKHFLKQIKGFKTSLKKFKEKSTILNINKKIEKDIEKELTNINKIITNKKF
jgi:ParB family transcriptional regulator, chromosome partitioning protein